VNRPHHNDCDAWKEVADEDLWIYDKLILSRKLGYVCGPSGVDVPEPGFYIVRPITNLLGMGIGAKVVWLTNTTDDLVEPGFFWCEMFSGTHLSVDYVNKEPVLQIEGLRDEGDSLWRWREWRRTKKNIKYPEVLSKLLTKDYPYVNIEFVDKKIIEVHTRLNPDWKDGDYASIIPLYEGENPDDPPEGYAFKSSKDYKRIGFFVK